MSNTSSKPDSTPVKLHRPMYEIHSSSSPAVEVPTKKGFGIEADDGPYSKWRIYNEFKPITKDRSTWPDEHTLLQDWHVPGVVESLNIADRRERYPADFDYHAKLRTNRLPRGRAAKEESRDAKGNVILRYLVYKKYYQLHGDEGASHTAHRIKSNPEKAPRPSVRDNKSWSLGDVARVQTEFTPTEKELKHGTERFRYVTQPCEYPNLEKGHTTSNKSQPHNSSSRAAAQTTGGESGTITNENPQAFEGKNSANLNSAAQTPPLDSHGNIRDYEQLFSKFSLDKLGATEIMARLPLSQDPFRLLGDPEVSEIRQPSLEGLSSRERFAVNVSRLEKHTHDLDEARTQAIQAMGEIDNLWAHTVGGMILTQEDEGAWLEAALERMQANMVEAMNTLQWGKLTEAYDQAGKMKEAVKERREDKALKLATYLVRSGVRADRIPQLVEFARKQFPLEDYSMLSDADFPDKPPSEKYPTFREDLRTLIDALKLKKYLNYRDVPKKASNGAPQPVAQMVPLYTPPKATYVSGTPIKGRHLIKSSPITSSPVNTPSKVGPQDRKEPEPTKSPVANDAATKAKRSAEPGDEEEASAKRARTTDKGDEPKSNDDETVEDNDLGE